MNVIYDIDPQVAALVDPETGEVLDYEAVVALQMEREAKIENMALMYKDGMAEAAAIRAEEKALAERRKKVEAWTERLKVYIDYTLGGEKFKTSKVTCSFRASTAVSVDGQFMEWAKQNGNAFLRYSEPEVNKTSIKEAIKAGQEVPHASLVENRNLIIK